MKCWLALFPVVFEGVQSPPSKGTTNSLKQNAKLFLPGSVTLAVEDKRLTDG